MNPSKRAAAICAIIYALGFVITFGHAASRTPDLGRNLNHAEETSRKGAGGLMAAMVWPLYWSWVAWEAKP